MQITQVHIRAYSQHKLNLRGQRSGGMKTFVEGTAIKIVMILDVPAATCTITIDDPSGNVLVNAEGMTNEADYIYSYVYQTAVSHFAEDPWTVILKATLDDVTMLTLDKFILLDNRRLATT